MGITLVGKPGTRALTVDEADDDGVSLALTVGDAVSVGEAEDVVVGEDVDCALVDPPSEQPARSTAAMATTGTSAPRRFLNCAVILGTVTRILRTCLTLLIGLVLRVVSVLSAEAARAEYPVKSKGQGSNARPSMVERPA